MTAQHTLHKKNLLLPKSKINGGNALNSRWHCTMSTTRGRCWFYGGWIISIKLIVLTTRRCTMQPVGSVRCCHDSFRQNCAHQRIRKEYGTALILAVTYCHDAVAAGTDRNQYQIWLVKRTLNIQFTVAFQMQRGHVLVHTGIQSTQIDLGGW